MCRKPQERRNMPMSNIFPVSTIKWTTLFFSLLLARSLGAGSNDCPLDCTCDWKYSSVKCKHIVNIPSDIPTGNISTLDFSTNSISSLEPGSMSYLVNIAVMKLSKNKITKLSNSTFSGMSKLKKLSLNENKISIIEPDAFKDLVQLELLDLDHNLISTLDANWLRRVQTITSFKIDYNNIRVIPPYVFAGFKNMTNLHLSNNNLTIIEPDAFSDIKGYLRLEMLYLSENQLEFIHAHALGKLSSLKVLYLNQNNFRTIESNEFINMVHLEQLHLTHLPYLRAVRRDAFAGLWNLQQLHLSNNKQLTEIDPNAFPVVPKLKGVFLENNSIQTLYEGLLPWGRLYVADLRFNNLTCDCHARWMSETNLLKTRNTTHMYASEMTCSRPPHLLSKPVLSLSSDDFKCAMESDNNMSGIINGAVSACVLFAALVTFALLVKYRHVIRASCIPKYRPQRDDPVFVDASDNTVEKEMETFIPFDTNDDNRF